MKLRTLALSSTALVLAGAAGFTAARALQENMPVAEPTEMHKWLRSHVGTWDAECTMMGETSKGTWKVAEGPGELWNVAHFEGEMGGMPFTGMELSGYDSAAQEFVQVWVDSTSTSMSIGRGTYDKAAKKLVMTGESVGTDGKPATMKHVTEFPDADHMNFTMSTPGPDGGDMEIMSIKYTRRK